MIRILTVCLGNICRSPIAEEALRLACAKVGVECFVDSCGTANYHVGKAPDSRIIATAKTQGIEIGQLRARQFSQRDFDNFDFIFTMDDQNYEDIIELAKNEDEISKVHRFQAFAEVEKPDFVPDPYYGTSRDFMETLEIVLHSSERIAKKLQKQNNG